MPRHGYSHLHSLTMQCCTTVSSSCYHAYLTPCVLTPVPHYSYLWAPYFPHLPCLLLLCCHFANPYLLRSRTRYHFFTPGRMVRAYAWPPPPTPFYGQPELGSRSDAF